jgi:hypothetical protein
MWVWPERAQGALVALGRVGEAGDLSAPYILGRRPMLLVARAERKDRGDGVG